MSVSEAPVRTPAVVPHPEPEAEPKPIGELASRVVRRLGREGGR